MVHGNFPKLIDGWPFPKMGNQPTWPWQCLDPRTPQALWRSETGSRRMAKSTVTGGIHTGRFVFLSWNMNTININIEKKNIYSIYIKYDIELHLLCLWSEYSMPFTYNYGVLWQSVANMLEPQRSSDSLAESKPDRIRHQNDQTCISIKGYKYIV